MADDAKRIATDVAFVPCSGMTARLASIVLRVEKQTVGDGFMKITIVTFKAKHD